MNIKTPSLAVVNLKVHPALFKAQLPDTLNTIRQAIPGWSAVHVLADLPAAGKRGSSKEEMRDELVGSLKPLAMLYDPIYTLTTPGIPPNAVATLVPDRVKPPHVAQYEGWKYIYYQESRALLDAFYDRALGGMPDGPIGPAEALLKGKTRGQAVLEGWTGSIGIPAYKRTMEAVVDAAGPVMFWDGAFGFESTGEMFLKGSDFVLGMFGSKDDRLYFDAAGFSWYVAINAGGSMRIGLLD